MKAADDGHTLVVGFTLDHVPFTVGGMVCNMAYVSEWEPQNITVIPVLLQAV